MLLDYNMERRSLSSLGSNALDYNMEEQTQGGKIHLKNQMVCEVEL